ncbi:hypothetical protein BC936DRAFT_137815 [Jimgerdemannia flammicorona]|uniref:FAD-binding domain-containing protein n=1 Tax=Jimgerdemannia flammicorona TaxID=994334 RepID=A0A433CWM0_9FUNG|nr:hypothetical protein BC936DRAFT_137815 [Jimgerdemannia flammicorona]
MTNIASQPKRVLIVGGGPVGLLTAYTLALYTDDSGAPLYNIDVFERRQDPRDKRHANDNWSFNIMLSARATRALREAGVYERILAKARPTGGLMISAASDDVREARSIPLNSVFGCEEEYISIGRDALMEGLLEVLEDLRKERGNNVKVTVHYETSCNKFRFEEKVVVVRKGEKDETFAYDFLVGSDGKCSIDQSPFSFNFNIWQLTHICIFLAGAGSRVRKAMMKLDSKITVSDAELGMALKAFKVPFKAVQEHGLAVWPFASAKGETTAPCYFFFCADQLSSVALLPNNDSYSVALSIHPPMKWDDFETLKDERDFILKHYPRLGPMLVKYAEPLFRVKPYQIVSANTSQFNLDGHPVMLIGDAAHAMPPTYGQGLNASFQDVTLLNQLLVSNSHSSFEQVAEAFSTTRKPSIDAITALSWEAYQLWRSDRVAIALFLISALKRAVLSRFPAVVQRALWHEAYPSSLIYCSTIDYSLIKEIRDRTKLTDPLILLVLVAWLAWAVYRLF